MLSNIKLAEEFNQPFNVNYGLNDDGSPSEDFIEFTHSDEIYQLVTINSIIVQRMLLRKILGLIGLLDPKVCFSSLNLTRYRLGAVEPIIEKYPYLQDLYEYSKKLNLPYVYISDDLYHTNSVMSIKNCWYGPFNYIHINMLLRYNPGFHSTHTIIDIQQKKAYFIDSSYGRIPSITESKEASLEVFLREYIDRDIIVERFDFDTCPAFSIQGGTDLCATWSFYLFLLILLNPQYTRMDIYNIFRQYSQSDRDFVILQFLYYLHSINVHNEIPEHMLVRYTAEAARKSFNIPNL